jgi:hypothetical protein
MKNLLIIAVLCLLVGCQSENPFLPNDVAEAMLKEKEVKPVENVAFVYNNDVYWLRNFDGVAKRITQTATVKHDIRQNYAHSRLAYLDANYSPVIIDTVGAMVKQLTTFKGVKQMDWTADDKTLYMLIGNDLQFYGPKPVVPAIEIEYNENVVSAVITKDLDLLYVVQTPTVYGIGTERLIKKNHDGTTITIRKPSGETGHMENIRLSKDGKHFILSYTNYPGEASYTEIGIYSLDDQYPKLTYDNDSYAEPIYDDVSGFLVMTENFGGYNDEFQLLAFYTRNEAFGEDLTKYLTYSTTKPEIYVDWK